jgi:hypothetical protein
MKFSTRSGYILFDSGKPGPLYVAPHAALAFEKMRDYQDSGTHYIVYRLAKHGGKAIISNITRERKIDFGIDFFRNPPTKKLSMKYYDIIRNSPKKKSYVFRKKYAWTAKSERDHESKKRIYRNFWQEIKKHRKNPIFFIHRQFLNPIRHPSIIDVIPFNYDNEIQSMISSLNNDYQKIFSKIFPFYKKAFYFKTDCVLFKEKMEKSTHLKMFRGKKPKIHKRIKRFSQRIKREPYVMLTFKKNFMGESIKRHIQREIMPTRQPLIELEISEFLTERFPNIAIQIIRDMIKMVNSDDNKTLQGAGS